MSHIIPSFNSAEPPPRIDIEMLVYRYPLTHGGDEDDCAAFLLHMEPSLDLLMGRYENIGIPSGAYWAHILRYQWKDYLRSKHTGISRQRQGDQQIGELLATTPDAAAAEPWEPVAIADHRAQRKQIMVAAVKACCDLSDAQVAVIAKSIERPDLQELVDRGRAMVDTTRADNLRRRMHQSLGRRLAGAASPDNRYKFTSRSYRECARDLRACRLAPTNRQVAEILDMPKGSVDTCLHWFQKHGERLAA